MILLLLLSFTTFQNPSRTIVKNCEILLEEGDMYNGIEENLLGNDVAGNRKL
jgi:hypothetical protein